MLKYSCKYKTKASSIYGEPNFAVINNLIKVTNLKYSSSILIPNAQDGIYVLPFARRFEHIDCYEDNIKLLDGGIIDNFECLGIRTRIKYSGVNNRIKLITKNYYSSPNNTKYDLVFAVRTLQLEENNSFSVSEKLHKLMENVKKGGYLYLMYYLNKDREIDKKQIIDYGYLKSLIDLNEWNIIYYRENTKRKTIHNAHPNNGLKHYHNVGNILLQRKKIKSPYVHIKRKCNRTYRAKSIYGNPDQQVYDYISFLKSIYKRNCDILVVDANDGKNVMPFARNNFNVTCFEDNRIFLHGGKIESTLFDVIKPYNDEMIKLLMKAKEIMDEAKEVGIQLDFDADINHDKPESYKDIIFNRNELQYVQQEVRDLEKKYHQLREKQVLSNLDIYREHIKDYNGTFGLIMTVENKDVSLLKSVADAMIEEMGTGFVFFADVKEDGSINFLSRSSCHANSGLIVKDAAVSSLGNGGGSPTFAQGGGKTKDALPKIYTHIEKVLRNEE